MAENVGIGLAVGIHLDYCRKLLHGITRYAETKPTWLLSHVDSDLDGIKALLKHSPQGIVAFVHTEEMAQLLETQFGGPMVNMCGALTNVRFPQVGEDNVRVGELAGTHLLDRGFRQFGFVSHPEHGYSAGRLRGFSKVLKASGFQTARHDCPAPLDLHASGICGRWTKNSKNGCNRSPNLSASSPAMTSTE